MIGNKVRSKKCRINFKDTYLVNEQIKIAVATALISALC